jgi:hypothetical protein
MPDTGGHEPITLQQIILSEVRETKDNIRKIAERVSDNGTTLTRLETTVLMHTKDANIHRSGDCDGLKGLTNKLWGVGVMAFSGLVGTIIMLGRMIFEKKAGG